MNRLDMDDFHGSDSWSFNPCACSSYSALTACSAYAPSASISGANVSAPSPNAIAPSTASGANTNAIFSCYII